MTTHSGANQGFFAVTPPTASLKHLFRPLFPATPISQPSGPATGSFNGLQPKSKLLAARLLMKTKPMILNIWSSLLKVRTLSTHVRHTVALSVWIASNILLPAVELHVAPAGSDLNTGINPNLPLATVSKAISIAGPGDVINLHSGIYREAITATSGGGQPGSPLLIRALPGALPIVTASDPVTDWTHHQGAIWKISNWTVNSQQVFCDSQPLQQIGMINSNNPEDLARILPSRGNGVPDMFPGSFHYDPSATTLYVYLPAGGNPNYHNLEVSIRPWAMKLTIPHVVIQDISFRHSNYTQWYVAPSQAAVVHTGPDSILERCDIQWGDFGGVLLQNRSQALNCNISNNGAVGIGASRYDYIPVRDIRVKGCVLSGNNYRGFSNSFHTGGVKLIPDISGIIEENHISDNAGPGVWIDWCRNGDEIIVRNNYIRRNERVGLMFEGSTNCIAYNNLITDSNGIGIYLSGSIKTRIYNNTISKSTGYSSMLLSNHSSGRSDLSDIVIANNIIADNTTIYDFIAPSSSAPNGTVLYSSDFNNYYRSNSISPFQIDGVTILGLSNLKSNHGIDTYSLDETPNFNLKDSDDFSLHSDSALIDAGINILGISSDIRGITRPSGASFDIGAFEFNPVDTKPPTTPTNLHVVHNAWNSFTIQWSPSSDNVSISGYDVYLQGEYFTTTTETSLKIENLPANRSYTVFVIAVDSSGLKSSASDPLVLTTGDKPDHESPTSPRKLKIGKTCGQGIQLTWSPSTDNIGVVFYRVYRNGNLLTETAATWWNDTSVEPGLKYSYCVSAVDAAQNESTSSKPVSVTLPLKDDKDRKDNWDRKDNEDREDNGDREDNRNCKDTDNDRKGKKYKTQQE